MGKLSKKGEVVRDYIERYNNMPAATIAKKLFEDFPLQFKSAEDARANVRYHIGSIGNKNRKQNKSKVSLDRSAVLRDLNRSRNQANPFDLPDSERGTVSDFILPSRCTEILWLSDIHIPNHDVDALTIALNYGIENKVNTVILGGDLLDNTPFSRFDHKPTSNDARQYFEDAIRFLASLRKHFRDADIFFMEGNHDAWYKKWLITKAPMLFDDQYYQLTERLGLRSEEHTSEL